METILRHFTFLSDEDFGTITKLCLKYSKNEEITENDGRTEMLLFFNSCVKPLLDRMLKDRKRMKRGAKNERKKR